jgi:hypothetical protein
MRQVTVMGVPFNSSLIAKAKELRKALVPL